MKLRPYQEVGRDFLAARKTAYLADEMRLGKTAQVVTAAALTGAKNVLVVCPAIATNHWQDEFRTWWPKDQALPKVTAVSYARMMLSLDVFMSVRWDLLVIDEGHFAKNPEAKRTQALFKSGGLAWNADRTWVVSGTPAPKHAGELWVILRAFGRTTLTYDQFLRKFCILNYQTGRPVGTITSRMPELREMMAPFMLRRLRKTVAPEMPAISYSFLQVESQKIDVPLPKGLSDSGVMLWLDRNSEDMASTRQDIAMAKAPYLAEVIEDEINSGELQQTVVFGWHIAPLEELTSALNGSNIKAEMITGATPQSERAKRLERFKFGETQVLVANIAAAGTAVDMSAASHGYLLELDWVPGNNVQAVNRLVRVGKNEPVTFDVVTWPGTMDDVVQRVLTRRAMELSKLFD